jgi:hypothetical protein
MKNMNLTLFEKYKEIESKIYPIVYFLQNNNENKDYKGLYKGIITLQSPLVSNPDILFLGINSGDGAYNEKNQTSKGNITPLRMIGEDERSFHELNWFEKGNAHGGNVNGKWVKYEWFQIDKKINNSFPKRMIDLLYEVGRLKYPEECKNIGYNKNSEPFWFEQFGKNIMYTNLYPIATTNVYDLNRILISMAKEKVIMKLIDKSTPNDWDVKLFFIRVIDELIKLVNPKVIVCLGKTAMNDFLYGKYNTNESIYIGEKHKIPVIGFSRRGNWGAEKNIEKIAKEIVGIH